MASDGFDRAQVRERAWSLIFVSACLAALVGLAYGWGAFAGPGRGVGWTPGWDAPADEAWRRGAATLHAAELAADVAHLAGPAMEGRDTPSLGLWRAGEYITQRLLVAGYAPAPGASAAGTEVSLRLPFPVTVRVPVAERCRLALEAAEGAPASAQAAPEVFEYGADFVPVPGASGTAAGELVFVGYGTRAPGRRGFDELEGRLAGRVVVVLEGDADRAEFGGPLLTEAAELYDKLKALEDKDAAGVLIVRRPSGAAAAGRRAGEVGFRHTHAGWLGERLPRGQFSEVPALALDRAAATRLLGVDVEALVREVDASELPVRRAFPGRRVRFESASTRTTTTADNIVGALRGSDPALAHEWVVLGAHYDHVGVDERGRIGLGADDNASGTAVLLELAEALAAARPRRSVLVCAFAAEEDGLLGSRALAQRPPIAGAGAGGEPPELVAMLNFDMVGRGEPGEVAAIGTRKNPGLQRLLDKALALSATGVDQLVTSGGSELFERSDHYSFHRAGVPALFFFEGLPISRNPDYHTWRDTVAKLSVEKMIRTAKLSYNTAWLLANDDERPPKPR